MNPLLAINIGKEMKMLAKVSLNNVFGAKNAEREIDMKIKKVYYNDPVTVVLWEDGTKTIVKAGEGDIYDPEKGMAMAISKKTLGNHGNYYNVFKKWLPEDVRPVGIEITSDDILFKQSDGSKIGFKDIASKFSDKNLTVDSVTLKEYCIMNNLTKNKVYGMIERNEVDAYKDEK